MSTEKLKWICALLALAPIAALAGQSVDETWVIDAQASVTIENVAGEIIVEGWGREEAHLSGVLADSVDELELKADRSSLRIRVVTHSHRDMDDTYLKLMIPNQANIDATGVSADVTVLEMDNRKITAASVSGDIEVEANSEWVSIESVSGDVNFDGETGRISAESVSGDIELYGISGEIGATTVSGDMQLQARVIEYAKLETVSGDIDMSGEVASNGRLTAESMSGDVTIILPAGQNGVFKAQSFSGRISTDFGQVEETRHGPGSYLKYVAGNSGAEIRVESFSGSITLEKN